MGKAVIVAIDGEERTSQLAIKADQALARLAAAGDREAFRNIVETHKQRMFTVARSVLHDAELAEDVVQESFIKAYRALADFKGESRLYTWLHRITYLTAIDFQRQRQRDLRHQQYHALYLKILLHRQLPRSAQHWNLAVHQHHSSQRPPCRHHHFGLHHRLQRRRRHLIRQLA